MSKQELWLTEAMKKFNKKFKRNYLNVLNSHAGSGKTKFIFNDFLNNPNKYICKCSNKFNFKLGKLLYICDTSMLKESVITENKNITITTNKETLLYEDNKIKVMTYAKLGMLLKDHECRNYILEMQCIILDEMHNLFKYANRFDTDDNIIYGIVIDNLSTMCKNTLTIGISATTGRIYSGIRNIDIETNTLFNSIELSQIKHYKHKVKIERNCMMNTVKNIALVLSWFRKNDYKVFLYTNTIKQSEKYKKHLIKAGFKVEWLCSINNTNKITTIDEKTGEQIIEKIPKMSEKQLQIRNDLINKEFTDIKGNTYIGGGFPNDLDVLIVNGAYETGWNLRDERVQVILIDSVDYDVQIQARSRIRHDILFLETTVKCDSNGIILDYDQYRNAYQTDEGVSIPILAKHIDEKYIGVKLTKDDKKHLVETYAMQHPQYSRTNWQTFKRDLKLADFILKTSKNGTYIFKHGSEVKKENKREVKKMNNENILINWVENEWDKKRITCQDVMDILDIGKKSFNNLIKSENILTYFKQHRYTIGNIKNSKTKYLMKY